MNKELITFILQRTGPISEMKLYKLIYFLETRYFEVTWRRIADFEFKRLQHGPIVSRGMRTSKDIHKETDSNSGITNYYTNQPADWLFDKSDEAILEAILAKYMPLSARQLRDLSHNESPYHIAGAIGAPIFVENIIYNDDSEDCQEDLKMSVSPQERPILARNLRKLVWKSMTTA